MTHKITSLQWVLLLILSAVLVWTTFSIVTVTYQTRQQFAQLEQLRNKHRALMENWGRLLLEESAFSSPARVERVAREELKMFLPGLEETQTFQQK
ncbi:MAG: cell division protein FtsL [Reinekea sp.]|jgi:cell division protein FtsL